MQINLSKTTALICASSKGIGFACAKQMAISGANVVLLSRNAQNLKKAKKEIEDHLLELKLNNKVFIEILDLTKISSLEKKLANILKKYMFDILVLNSGGPNLCSFLEFSNAKEFSKQCNYELTFSTTLLKLIIPQMIKKNYGRIINISSISLKKPISGLAVSNASRSFMAGLMTGLIKEVAQFNVTVNSVLPGIIWTERQEKLTKLESINQKKSFKKLINEKKDSIPSKCLGNPEDIASLVTFLASNNARYINGQFICVDGGLLGINA
jgi:3-oxoacyl-[acyl-carrier protein] reductase